MIKKLISDLAYDKITLTQGLTRGKLIAHRLKDEILKTWLNNELKGYFKVKPEFPKHRIIPCRIEGVVCDRFGREEKIPLDASEIDEALDGILYKIEYLNSIPDIENNIKHKERSDELIAYLPTPMLPQLSDYYQLKKRGLAFKYVMRVYAKSHVIEILYLTKQNFLDMLLELEENVGEFEDDYEPTKEEKQNAHQIINNYVSGSNNNQTLGVGKKVKQKVINHTTQTQFNELKNKLKDLGVGESELIELESKVSDADDKGVMVKKALKWAGKIANKAVEKGVDYKIPEIIDTISSYI